MKRNLILITIFIILLIPMFFSKKENVIKDLTFTQIEDKSTPLNYKKEYTFMIKELSSKKNSLEFNTIGLLTLTLLIFNAPPLDATLSVKLVFSTVK